MDPTVAQNVGLSVIFAVVGGIVGIALVLASTLVIPKLIDRMTPTNPEPRRRNPSTARALPPCAGWSRRRLRARQRTPGALEVEDLPTSLGEFHQDSDPPWPIHQGQGPRSAVTGRSLTDETDATLGGGRLRWLRRRRVLSAGAGA